MAKSKVRKRKTYRVEWIEPGNNKQEITVESARGVPDKQHIYAAIKASGRPYSGVQILVYDSSDSVVRHIPTGRLPPK